MNIRPLTEDDAADWREVRARMLREHPEAFGEDESDFLARDEAELRDRMRTGNVIGAWVEGKLAGTVGWVAGRGRKRKHVAEIWGMYVVAETRRAGLARALLRAAFDASRAVGVSVWELGVEENNLSARRLYESEGFSVWGTEHDAYRFDGRSVNVCHMSRFAGA
ncbi:MAG: GNAT family N-acetyltransferase [Planctomycetes bacterium]|nr:GNAT family N-acetyltransferase [Planctomycetota bacterium]